MTTSVLLLIVLASVLHATWNLGSRHYRLKPGFMWGVGLWGGISALGALPFVFRQLDWSWVALACGLISGLFLAIFYFFLERAYRQGDISLVYPIVRSSPLWVALAGVCFMGVTLSLLAWLGIVLVLLGICILPLGRLRFLRRRTVVVEGENRLRASLFAIGASLGTSVYTLSDKFAMDHASLGPLAGVALTGLASTSKLIFWFLLDPGANRGFDWGRLSVPGVPVYKMAFFGFCAFSAYAMIICAMIYADAGRVLATSNLAVVLGSVGGMIFFKERTDVGIRLLGLAMTVSGIVLLRLY